MERKEGPSHREFVALNDATQRVLDSVTGKEILDGILLEDLTLTGAVENVIPHKLGRKYRGFHPVRNSSGATFDENYNSTDREVNLRVTPSADCKASIWVF